MKVWFKTYKRNKLVITKAFSFQNETTLFDISTFCANEFDLPCPIILQKHKKYFKDFGIVKFFKSDFIEDISCDAVELEIFE